MGVVVGIYVDILLLVLEGQEAADPRKAAIRAARGERGSNTSMVAHSWAHASI